MFYITPATYFCFHVVVITYLVIVIFSLFSEFVLWTMKKFLGIDKLNEEDE
jgi:hypothetical protein